MPNYLYNPYTDTFTDSSEIDYIEGQRSKIEEVYIPDFLMPKLNKKLFEEKYKILGLRKQKNNSEKGEDYELFTIKRKYDEKLYKCKAIKESEIKSIYEDPLTAMKVPMEIFVLNSLKDEKDLSVIKYVEYFYKKEKNFFGEVNETEGSFYIISEYLDQNWISLNKYIGESGLKEKEAKLIFRQIYSTVEELERRGYFHNDLSTKNILINMKTKKIKLINFGNAVFQTYIPDNNRRDSKATKSNIGSTDSLLPIEQNNSFNLNTTHNFRSNLSLNATPKFGSPQTENTTNIEKADFSELSSFFNGQTPESSRALGSTVTFQAATEKNNNYFTYNKLSEQRNSFSFFQEPQEVFSLGKLLEDLILGNKFRLVFETSEQDLNEKETKLKKYLIKKKKRSTKILKQNILQMLDPNIDTRIQFKSLHNLKFCCESFKSKDIKLAKVKNIFQMQFQRLRSYPSVSSLPSVSIESNYQDFAIEDYSSFVSITSTNATNKDIFYRFCRNCIYYFSYFSCKTHHDFED
ncbi:hypothetical protein HK099_005082 [Clydaea vesicula]|uniref:Protein kinase domain-containing protein n=1 Tax=Clydaea vesicula TaxID=447962 RepID=A0AAD5TZE2_9FUNG|nr:hypothetical protein HK099_005082 [Clydaea vesicula]KAJ3388183.1 hypothetical protein HDU92_001593 [Lobulomyces angularis]